MRDTDLAISFFTFLTVLANGAALGILGLAVVTRFGVAQRAWTALWSQLVDGGLAVAWLVAAVSTSGSLYFSEVSGFVPCRLCWFQRGCMYPLVAVLAVAALLRNRSDEAHLVRRIGAISRGVAVTLAGLGAVIATYHVLVERFPSLESGTCDPSVPCSLIWFERLGFVTLPYMALSGFALILVLLVTPSLAQPSFEEAF